MHILDTINRTRTNFNSIAILTKSDFSDHLIKLKGHTIDVIFVPKNYQMTQYEEWTIRGALSANGLIRKY